MGTIELLPSNNTGLQDNFKFNMSFDKLDGAAGNWDFKLNVTKAELSKSASVYEPNQPVAFNSNNFTISKVALTPLNTLISMHSTTVQQMPSSFFDYWIVLDDKGNELTQVGGTGNQDSDITVAYSKADENTKYLTIIPYRRYQGIEPGKGNQLETQPDAAVDYDSRITVRLK